MSSDTWLPDVGLRPGRSLRLYFHGGPLDGRSITMTEPTYAVGELIEMHVGECLYRSVKRWDGKAPQIVLQHEGWVEDLGVRG